MDLGEVDPAESPPALFAGLSKASFASCVFRSVVYKLCFPFLMSAQELVRDSVQQRGIG